MLLNTTWIIGWHRTVTLRWINISVNISSLASLACIMSSRGKRLCPGVDGRKCGAYMSPVFRDPHPTCARCRGRNCARDSTCSSCQDWSLAQWEAFHDKHSYTDRKKSNSRHGGGPTSLTSESPISSAPVKQAAPSLAPPPLSAPPPLLQRGLGLGKRRKVKTPKQTRVFSSPQLLASKQEERRETRTVS